MRDWKELSYAGSGEPFARQMSYDEAQRIYALYCERLSFSRTRSGPLRRVVSPEDKQRFMETVYGKQVARDEDTGRRMFAGIAPQLVDQFHAAKARYEDLRGQLGELQRGLTRDRWTQKEILEIAHDCGAEVAGFTRYYDPIYRKEMAALVFAIGMKEVNRLKVPSLEQCSLAFRKNVEIQSITNRIAERIWASGVYCEPIACATYYHLDNIEFSQVRFCEAAFSGSIGKNFLFLTREFGPKFRMSQVILHVAEGMEFKTPEAIEFCGGCSICVDACPSKALRIDDVVVCSRYFMTHDHCSICMDVCPIGKS